MNRLEFETKLNEFYKGAVKPLTPYYNKHAVMVFCCTDCQYTFFGKAGHIVGKQHQRHACGLPYSDQNGERLKSVSKRHRIKKKETFKIDDLYKMIWNDYGYKEIAQELRVNPIIIKDYFKSEGLI
ncbi:adenylate kinase [Robertmurraya kyonggiensis]|uniref:Adenylate kinase n=1 Tax=Robertmurraya kyonggiensis TaxID=1037680 RepID=A0A4U1D9S2_9BACI|nr:adenylate kinase [Robertmurraya kyonggiensis]TKC18176.1 adenylate kinase [Robertmurraya kyonggiensis]